MEGLGTPIVSPGAVPLQLEFKINIKGTPWGVFVLKLGYNDKGEILPGREWKINMETMHRYLVAQLIEGCQWAFSPVPKFRVVLFFLSYFHRLPVLVNDPIENEVLPEKKWNAVVAETLKERSMKWAGPRSLLDWLEQEDDVRYERKKKEGTSERIRKWFVTM